MPYLYHIQPRVDHSLTQKTLKKKSQFWELQFFINFTYQSYHANLCENDDLILMLYTPPPSKHRWPSNWPVMATFLYQKHHDLRSFFRHGKHVAQGEARFLVEGKTQK